MRKYNTDAIVLKNLNYGDAHKIYTLMTQDYGKVSAVARGVRKISSRRAGNLDTLNIITVSITENKDCYRNLVYFRTLNTNKKVKEKLETSAQGFYIADLVQAFVDFDDKNVEVYDLMEETLELLDKNNLPLNLVVNFFEVKLMKVLGYGLSLDRCAKCKRKYDGNWESVKFNQSFGGFICDNCDIVGFELEKSSADLLNLLGKGDLRVLRKEFSAKFEEETLKKVNSLVKSYIQNVLEDNTGFSRARKSLFPLL